MDVSDKLVLSVRSKQLCDAVSSRHLLNLVFRPTLVSERERERERERESVNMLVLQRSAVYVQHCGLCCNFFSTMSRQSDTALPVGTPCC